MGMIPSKKVFISSTTKDLFNYREEAIKVINQLTDDYKNRFQLVEVTMDTEYLDGERIPPVDRSKSWVDTSDWFILIVAWNYGYIQPGEQYSVTEWEYRHALENSKPCFIFLAGEIDDGEKQYFPIKGRDTENLSNWRARENQSEDDANKLKQFKNELRKKDFKIFSDLDNFLEQLRGSLKKRIDSELSPPNKDMIYDAQLLSVLVQITDQIQSCIEGVKLLANLKRIHDLLHKIRQLGIRRWREEVSSLWSNGMLSGEAKITYLLGLNKINESRWKLEGYLQLIPDQTDSLKDEIRKVLNTDFKEHPDAKTEFEKITNQYAGRVQHAFTATNTAMLKKANMIQYCQLFNSSKPGAKPFLRSKDEYFLTQKIQALNTEHAALQSVFFQHHAWQCMHDQLERMDSTKGSEFFNDDLEDFLDNPEVIDRLLDHAFQVAEQSGSQEIWRVKIEAVKRNFEALRNNRTEATYEAMRKTFDDLFFDVDVVTLAAVTVSEHCANQNFMDLQAMLNQVQARITPLHHDI